MMTRTGLFVLAISFLISCATTVTDENSPYYRIPVGAVVVLQQDLTVPLGHARVFLQGGKVVEKRHLDIYRPHCNFEQHSVSNGAAVIKADRFKVTAVSTGDDLVVQRDGFIHAGWNLVGESDGVNMVNRYVRHALTSPNQPQVKHLTCHGGFYLAADALTPSLTDIRTALGVLATIEFP